MLDVKYVIALVFCVFMGITALSLGIGVLVPQINTIAQPMVCSGGEMVHKRKVSNPMPGRTYTQSAWTCQTASGATAISAFEIALYAGSVHGLILFVPVLFLMVLRRASPVVLRRR